MYDLLDQTSLEVMSAQLGDNPHPHREKKKKAQWRIQTPSSSAPNSSLGRHTAAKWTFACSSPLRSPLAVCRTSFPALRGPSPGAELTDCCVLCGRQEARGADRGRTLETDHLGSNVSLCHPPSMVLSKAIMSLSLSLPICERGCMGMSGSALPAESDTVGAGWPKPPLTLC